MATIRKRTGKDGCAIYHTQVRLKGYPVQTASFERLPDAKKWAASTESALRENRHFKTAEAKRHTFADAIDKYETTIFGFLPKNNVIGDLSLHGGAIVLGIVY